MMGAFHYLSIDYFGILCKMFNNTFSEWYNYLHKSQEVCMSIIFPSAEWLKALEQKLNSDERYGQIAKNWEGDLFFYIEPEGNLQETLTLYLDLWHGKCRRVEYTPKPESHPSPTFILRSPYNNFTAILQGKLDTMTAMMTMKLRIQGSMGYMMRNVPTVLDFVRCCREITTEIL
jgi:putative sterol carrier protein